MPDRAARELEPLRPGSPVVAGTLVGRGSLGEPDTAAATTARLTMGGKVYPLPGVTPGPGQLIYIEIGHRKLESAPSGNAIDSDRCLVIHPRNLIRAKLTGPSCPAEQPAASWQL